MDEAFSLITHRLKYMVETDSSLLYAKRKAITAILPYIIQVEKNGNHEALQVFLHAVKASKHQDFIWRHIDPFILTLLKQASPLAAILISPYLNWTSPQSSDWVEIWKFAVFLAPNTEEVSCSVVDTLLQVASVGSLQPHIPAHLWSLVKGQPALPPICRGRSVGSVGSVLQLVRELGDIDILKSYLLLTWSEWDCPSSGLDGIHTLIWYFSGIGMFQYRADLLQHLDHILTQLNLGLDHFREQKPSISGNIIQQMKDQYGEFRELLLEADREAMSTLACKSYQYSVHFLFTDSGIAYHATFTCAIPLPCL